MQHDTQHDPAWTERLQDSLDGELDAAGEAVLAAHLEQCAECRSQAHLLRELEAGLHAAAPHLTLDSTFDQRLLAEIGRNDESQRMEARRRIEREFEQSLHALRLKWRRALGFVLPGIVGGIAVALALSTWLDDSGLTRALIAESSATLGQQGSEMLRLSLTTLLGAGLGLGLARWLASVAD